MVKLINTRNPPLPIREFDLTNAQQENPACGEVLHFNNDGAALMPHPVVQSLMIDSDLRNLLRFSEDFRFQLPQDEFDILKSQIATSMSKYGGRRYRLFCSRYFLILYVCCPPVVPTGISLFFS